MSWHLHVPGVETREQKMAEEGCVTEEQAGRKAEREVVWKRGREQLRTGQTQINL